MNRCKLIAIGRLESPSAESTINNDLVYQQLNKIIAHPLFSGSAILCKFLLYIVNETLADNTDKIKEYTIAVNVLNKPKNFEVQKDAIVRIHASRLRKALTNYYRSACKDDKVIILVPKGRYIPTFQPLGLMASDAIDNIRNKHPHSYSNKITMAILPFKSYERNFSRIAFADSLGQRLSVELSRDTHFLILSYNIFKVSERGQLRSEQLAENLSLKYVLSGDVHFEGEHTLVFVRLTDLSTGHQVWSDMYHFNDHFPSYFELSDRISARIISSLRLLVSDLNQSVSNMRQPRGCADSKT